jgi:quercetin dioxygenase-like cupin family protein
MAFVWQRGDGDRLPLGPNLITYKVDGDAGQGRFSLLEYDITPGSVAPALHTHDFDEAFYVLDGELTLDLGERGIERLGPGGCAFIPGGEVHTWRNDAPAAVRMLVICTPSGFEQYFRDIAGHLEQEPPDPARFAEIATGYGLRYV